MAKVGRMSLGDVLLKEGFASEEDFKKAKEYQRKEGGKLADILVKLGIISEEQLVVGFSKQLGIPHIKLRNYKLDPEIIKILPIKIIRKEKVIPLDKSGENLTIVTSDPLNVLLIDNLRARTGYNIQIIIATPTEIEQTIDDYYTTLAPKI